MNALISVLSVFLIIVSVSSSVSAANRPMSSSVSVSASVPGYWWLELTGWTSPEAVVDLGMAQILSRQTTADKDGFFRFSLGLPRTLAPLCLIATDVAKTSSHPLCLPPPPADVNILIQQVVMPPTLSLSRGQTLWGETVAAQGYTTPNSEVIPYLFEEQSLERKNPFLSKSEILSTKSETNSNVQKFNVLNSFDYLFFGIWKIVSSFEFRISNLSIYAAEVPKPPIKSDQSGFYQFNLPTGEIGKNRVFVGSLFLNNPSPKSNTLVFDVLWWWQLILKMLIAYGLWLMGVILGFLTSLPGIILLEVIILGILLFLLKRKKSVKALWLPLRAIVKFQIPSTKLQTITNDRNNKF